VEVTDIVKHFESKTSEGVDNYIPLHILKTTINSIAEPLSRLINCSFSTGIFPQNLKIGKICPVYKDGDKDTFSNYKLISVLHSFLKIYEKAVFNRILFYLDTNNILTHKQYGFQYNHSTYMAIFGHVMFPISYIL